jgi:D-serine deaminase-like pyridoxal phosphate-dependent protein
MTLPWYTVANVAEVPSPSLLIYPDRVEKNVRRMIEIAGGTGRLRPHIKTHKLPEVIRIQMGFGISKFKCATVAETEMVAACCAPDVLLAYQPVGPNVKRLIQLIKAFPNTKFSAIADDADTIRSISNAVAAADASLDLLLDVDSGMHRTGVAPGPRAVELYRLIAQSPGLRPGGLHAYDGHLNQTDVPERTKTCEAAFALVDALRQELVKAGLPVPRIVAGGTPTFPIHARRADVECSPGTTLFWDFSYTDKLPDLDFLPAALLLTRVVSKPGTNLLCLDLGHKAVAAENPHPRVQFLDLPGVTATNHSEEHLVIETARANEFKVGDVLYGVPRHICPTVALHSEAVVVKNGQATGRWKVVARERALTI